MYVTLEPFGVFHLCSMATKGYQTDRHTDGRADRHMTPTVQSSIFGVDGGCIACCWLGLLSVVVLVVKDCWQSDGRIDNAGGVAVAWCS